MRKYNAYAGIDWASEKHDVQSSIEGQAIVKSSVVPHKVEAIREYFDRLCEASGGDVAVCLEQSRGPLFNVLREIPGVHIYPVNPATLARFRRAFAPSGAKDDEGDACHAREILQQHGAYLRRARVMSEETRRLDQLVRLRRDAVDDQVRLGLKLRDALKGYFPQILDIFDDLKAPIVRAFLARWIEHAKVRSVEAEELEAFFRRYHSGSREKNAKRIAILKDTESMIRARCIIEPFILQVRRLCAEMEALHTAIREFDKALEQVVPQHPDHAVFSSFPEAGKVHTARLIAVFGDDREFFSCAEAVANAVGISPVQKQSGKSKIISARVAKSRFHHQSILEWAGGTIKTCEWAKLFYRRKRAQGKTHRVAQRALAFKWIRILYRCWKDRTPYLPEVYKKGLAS